MPRAGLDKEVVLRSARQIANQQGLDALTLRGIAHKLKVKPPSLYNHVEGIDALRRELGLEGNRQLEARFARATAGLSRGDAVRAIAHEYRAFAREQPGVYQASVVAPAKGDAEAQQVAGQVLSIVQRVLAGYGLQGNDSIHATRALRSFLHGFVTLEQARGFGLPVQLDESFDRLVSLLIRTLAPEGERLKPPV